MSTKYHLTKRPDVVGRYDCEENWNISPKDKKEWAEYQKWLKVKTNKPLKAPPSDAHELVGGKWVAEKKPALVKKTITERVAAIEKRLGIS